MNWYLVKYTFNHAEYEVKVQAENADSAREKVQQSVKISCEEVTSVELI